MLYMFQTNGWWLKQGLEFESCVWRKALMGVLAPPGCGCSWLKQPSLKDICGLNSLLAFLSIYAGPIHFSY